VAILPRRAAADGGRPLGRLGGPRIHDWEAARRATWLELFFDLVFVVAVARLGVLLHDDHSVGGVLVFAGLLVPVWWAWISFSYYADLFDDDGPLNRLAQLAAMLGAAVVAVTITNGVADDSGRFAATFAVLFVLLALLYALAWRAEPRARELCRWYVVGSATGAAGWAASLAVAPPARYLVWAVALAANALISGPIAYARMTAPPQQRSHMPERFGLFTIVVLGEAVLAVVNGIDPAGGGAAETAAIAGFVVAACIWWLYFDQFDEAAIDRAIEGGRRAQVRSFLYGYGHLLLYAAIVTCGVGVQLSAEQAAHGGGAVPLLGVGVAGVIAGFLLVSSGIGLHGRPVVIAAKLALAVGAVVVTAAGRVDAAPAAVAVAAGWAGLVLLEWRVGPWAGGRAGVDGPADVDGATGGG
jgi:low temperature requirement protein LtrA